MTSSNKETSLDDVTTTDAFFIKNKDSKFALFNHDGKQLTDFEFDYASKFENGNAKVKKDKKEGIISSSGKMTIDFGKYKYIDPVGGMFNVTGKNYQKLLIDGEGKKLYDLEEKDVSTFIGVNLTILLDEKKETYSILDRKGKTIVSFSYDEDIEKPEVSELDGVVSIYYNGKNYIVNQMTGKLITKFNSDKEYGIARVFSKENRIVLASSSGDSHQLIEKGKLVEFDSACDKLGIDRNDNLLCEVNGEKFLFDKEYKKKVSTNSTAYHSSKSYVKNNEKSFGGVDFYQDGKLVKNVACRKLLETGPTYQDIYVLATYFSSTCNTEAGHYEFYNAKGEKAIEKSFMKASGFDENGFAVVSENKTDFYFIDTKGKKISKTYDKIMGLKGYYVTIKDNKRGVLNTKGEEIIPTKYIRTDNYTRFDNDYLALKDEKSNTTVYDMKKGKEIFSSKGVFEFGDDYIKVIKDGKASYYSYKTGKMIYEE